ncbi:hypothetical protein L484_020255 [Morus notabilis]|uniref:Uncharacterized protein n=1 Tax=Morus notabilis TaxID=981085 RepID=W9RM91_9ROSA|nr:hypothetical protein L484_020255 [Morus notabilis]
MAFNKISVLLLLLITTAMADARFVFRKDSDAFQPERVYAPELAPFARASISLRRAVAAEMRSRAVLRNAPALRLSLRVLRS